MSSNEGGAPLGTGAGAGEDGEVSAHSALHTMIARGASFSGRERNCVFANMGDGTFVDMSAGSGLDLPDDTRAVARVDVDRDGDLDLWVTCRSGPMLRLLRNDQASGNTFVQLALAGTRCNTHGIGARVELDVEQDGVVRTQVHAVSAGEGFLAQSSRIAHFGLAAGARIDALRVLWPGGEWEEFAGVEAGARWTLTQGSGQAARVALAAAPAPLAASRLPGSAPTDGGRVVLASTLPLPAISYTGADGAAVAREPSGRPLVLNLWGSWCAPCLSELKEWSAHAEQLAGVDVLALSLDELPGADGSADAARARMDALGFPFEWGLATPDLVTQLQRVHDTLFARRIPLPLPTTFVLNGQGELSVVRRGTTSVDDLLADLATFELDGAARRDAAVPFAGRWHQGLRAHRLTALARGWIEDGQLDAAADYLARHINRLRGEAAFPRVAAEVGTRLLAEERAAEALVFFGLALQARPTFAKAHFNAAIACEQLGDDGQALQHYRSALEQRPKYWQANYNLALLLRIAGDVDGARAQLEQAHAVNAAFAGSAAELASLELVEGRPVVALEWARRAHATDPAHARLLAEVCAANGLYDEAIEHAEVALEAAVQAGPEPAAEALRMLLADWRKR